MSVLKKTTREIILEIASELFMDKGFQATSTRMIAERAGITQPNLYYHFKTKESIYISVLEILSAEVKKQLNRMVKEENKALEETLLSIIEYLKAKHPVNLFIMRHDISHEMSKEKHLFLYNLWRQSYLQPLIDLFDGYVNEDSHFNSTELSMHFYGNISQYIQKEDSPHVTLSAEQLVHLFVYGIIDRDKK